eukprot:2128404-Rhodomonas_salina.1
MKRKQRPQNERTLTIEPSLRCPALLLSLRVRRGKASRRSSACPPRPKPNRANQLRVGEFGVSHAKDCRAYQTRVGNRKAPRSRSGNHPGKEDLGSHCWPKQERQSSFHASHRNVRKKRASPKGGEALARFA